MDDQLKYPIGKATIPAIISATDIKIWIQTIEEFPEKLDKLTAHLSESQLDTAYRKHGWTIRQVIHHCADSHQHSYTRFKWALTEDKPLIKAYYEERWAELTDGKTAPILLSINVLKALHAKWVYFLKGLNDSQLSTYFVHPSGNEKVYLNATIGMYAWHCNHHYAHIFNLMVLKNWV